MSSSVSISSGDQSIQLRSDRPLNGALNVSIPYGEYSSLNGKFCKLPVHNRQGLRMRIYIPQKITITVKKSATLPAAALPFAAADRDWNRTARTFLPKSSLAIGQSGSAAVPLPRVSPFLFYLCLFSVYTFFMRNPCLIV